MKRISGNQVIYKFKHNMDYVETILPGDVVQVETNDCFFQQVFREDQLLTEIDYDKLNPATRPIYVDGAELGDLLQVKIINIDVSNRGIAAVVPNEGALGDQAVQHIKDSLDIEWEDAYMMASLAVDLKISQVVDPKMTVRAAIPNYLVSTEDLIKSL